MWCAAYKFIGTKEFVYTKKEFTKTTLAWETNIAPVILFWDNNMAVMTSYENAPCSMSFKASWNLLSIGFLVVY